MAASCISLPGQDPQGRAEPSDLEGFARLDELSLRMASGYLLVHAAPEQLGAIARHLERRTMGMARRVVCVDASTASEPWREVAKRLGVAGDDPREVAERILRQAGDAVILVCAPRVTRWGTAVADALAEAVAGETVPCASWLVELSPARRCPHARPLVVAPDASTADVERYHQALVADERRAGHSISRYDRLERAWWNARGAAPLESRMSPKARRALVRLSLVGRGVSRDQQRALDLEGVRDELLASGLVGADRTGVVWLRAPVPGAPIVEDVRMVATALTVQGDAWDGLRAAELLLTIDAVDEAVTTARDALRAASALAREDLWSRLESALAHLEPDVQALLRLSACALELGDGDPALRLARAAAAAADEGFQSLLAIGKASAARGDWTTAEAMLGRARDRTEDPRERLEAAVELADVLCMTGATERARELASSCVASAPAPTLRLAGRNVLGKLLLAASDWDAAERFFAEDAHDAAVNGLTEPELRAHLNRATALMGAGRRTEARALLEELLDRAERDGVLRAQAFALSNLAVLASQRHDYAEALSLREEAIQRFRRIGNRKWLGRSMIYLADLRLDLGFVDEAEQALAFARQVLGQVVPPTQAAWMGLVASRVHLERRHVGRAASEIEAARCSAARSNDGTMLCDCHTLAARIALADGDVERARIEIERAQASKGGANRAAEIALVQARLEQRCERPYVAAARRALALARSNNDRARMAEAHVLLHEAWVAEGDVDRARVELEAARAVHQTISAALSPTLRARYCERIERRAPPRRVVVETQPDAQPSSRRGGRGSGGMVGSHPSMMRMFTVLEKIAPTDATVLVSGESGTGKELVADAIHRESARHRGPLVKVNCAALVETLLMSELFGHEKGAFTGAATQRRGCFEHADGGTVFLDEIGDISPATQAALLRVLQDRTFHRVGGTEPVRVDVRVICATHRDLKAMVDAGTFREDLYYRLSGMILEVPPLRERVADVPLLANDILLRMSRQTDVPLKRLDPDAIALLGTHTWPGNVRELENVLRAAALFTEGEAIAADDLRRHAPSLRDACETPATSGQSAADGSGAPEDAVYAAVRGGTGLRELQKRLEIECIVRALNETGGHVTRAAALLGIKRPRLSQLIKQHNLRAAGGES